MSCGRWTKRIELRPRRSISETATNLCEWTDATVILKEAYFFGQGDTCLVSSSMAHFHRRHRHRHRHYHSPHNHGYYGYNGEEDEDNEEFLETTNWHDNLNWFKDSRGWLTESRDPFDEYYSTPKANEMSNSSRYWSPGSTHSVNTPFPPINEQYPNNKSYHSNEKAYDDEPTKWDQRMNNKQVFTSVLEDQESLETSILPDTEMNTSLNNYMDNNVSQPGFIDENGRTKQRSINDNSLNQIIEENNRQSKMKNEEDTIREVFLKCPEDVKNLLRNRLEELAIVNQNTMRSCLGPSIDDALFRLFGVVRRWLTSWKNIGSSDGVCACGSDCGTLTTCALKWLHHEYLTLADELMAASKLEDGENETRRLADKRKLLDAISQLLNGKEAQEEYMTETEMQKNNMFATSSSPTSPSALYEDDFSDEGDEKSFSDESNTDSFVSEKIQSSKWTKGLHSEYVPTENRAKKIRGNICKGGKCSGLCSGKENCQKIPMNQGQNKTNYSSQAFRDSHLKKAYEKGNMENSKPCICYPEVISVHAFDNSSMKKNSFDQLSFFGNDKPEIKRKERKIRNCKKNMKQQPDSSYMKSKTFEMNNMKTIMTPCKKTSYEYWPKELPSINSLLATDHLPPNNYAKEYENEIRALNEMALNSIQELQNPFEKNTGCNNPCCKLLKSCAPHDINQDQCLSDSLGQSEPEQPVPLNNSNTSSVPLCCKTPPPNEKKEEFKMKEEKSDEKPKIQNSSSVKQEDEEMLVRIMTKLNLIEQRLDQKKINNELSPAKCQCLGKGQCIQKYPVYQPDDFQANIDEYIPDQKYSFILYNNWDKQKRKSHRHHRRQLYHHQYHDSSESTSRGQTHRGFSSKKSSSSSLDTYEMPLKNSLIEPRSFLRYLFQMRKTKRIRPKQKHRKINVLYSSSENSDDHHNLHHRNLLDIIYEPKLKNKRLDNHYESGSEIQYKYNNLPSDVYLSLFKSKIKLPKKNLFISENTKPKYQDKSSQVTRNPIFEDAATCVEQQIFGGRFPTTNLKSLQIQQHSKEHLNKIHNSPIRVCPIETKDEIDEIPVKDVSYPNVKSREDGLCLLPGSSVGHSLKQIGQLKGVKVFKRSSRVPVDPILGVRLNQLHAKVSKERKDLDMKANKLKQQISNNSLAVLLEERSKLCRDRDNLSKTSNNTSSCKPLLKGQPADKRNRRKRKQGYKERKDSSESSRTLYKTVAGTLSSWLTSNLHKEKKS